LVALSVVTQIFEAELLFVAPPIHADPNRSMMDTSTSASPYFQVYATLGWTSVHELALPLFASALAASDWRSAAPHVLSLSLPLAALVGKLAWWRMTW
jgi:hypothetical protein